MDIKWIYDTRKQKYKKEIFEIIKFIKLQTILVILKPNSRDFYQNYYRPCFFALKFTSQLKT